MGPKRPYNDADASTSARGPASKKRKQFKTNNPKDGGGAPQGQSLNEAKKRARDIERQFARGKQLPADVQRNLERELAHCKTQIEELQHKKKRNEMISKYHKIRFFGTRRPKKIYLDSLTRSMLTWNVQRDKKPRG